MHNRHPQSATGRRASTSTHVYAELRPLIPKPLAVHPTALALPVAGSAANALTLAPSASDGPCPCPWPTRTNRRRMFSKAVLLIGATFRFVDGDRRVTREAAGWLQEALSCLCSVLSFIAELGEGSDRRSGAMGGVSSGGAASGARASSSERPVAHASSALSRLLLRRRSDRQRGCGRRGGDRRMAPTR